jgi:Trypsin-like peptidase domain
MAMRCTVFLLLLALAAGPASAQEGARPGNPGPIQAATPTAAKPAAKHHVARKRRHRAAKLAAKPTAKPAAATRRVAKHHAAAKSAKRAPVTRHVPLPPPAPKSVVAKATPAGVPLPPRHPILASTNTKPVEPAPATAASVPSDERRQIQSALLWAGDYASASKGEDPLVAAIKSFQKRHKAKITGELTPAERNALLAAARAHEKEFGWSVVVDPATGIRLGLPTKLVPHAQDAAHGTRWTSAHGEVQVETFRIKRPGLKLADVFAQEKRAPRARRVERSELHDDSFVIGGMQGLKYFSVRAQMRDGEVRGFTLLYDQAMEGIVTPVLEPMASAFSPFPERSAPFAALAKSVEYGTGLIVSGEGHILTARKVADGCQVIVVPGLGDADRVAEDKTDGLALLRVYGQRKLSALLFAGDAPKTAELTLIGIPDPREQNGRQTLTEVKARLSGTAIELRQPVPVAGFSGAAALDAQGRALGMMQTRNAVLASTAPSAPPVWLVPAATIGSFLSRQHVPTAKTPGEARDAVVRVICVRK